MSEAEEGKTSHRKRPPIVLFIFPLLIGLLGFYRLAQSPHFASYRTVDVIQLLGTGACIGVTLVGSIVWLVRRRS